MIPAFPNSMNWVNTLPYTFSLNPILNQLKKGVKSLICIFDLCQLRSDCKSSTGVYSRNPIFCRNKTWHLLLHGVPKESPMNLKVHPELISRRQKGKMHIKDATPFTMNNLDNVLCLGIITHQRVNILWMQHMFI